GEVARPDFDDEEVAVLVVDRGEGNAERGVIPLRDGWEGAVYMSANIPFAAGRTGHRVPGIRDADLAGPYPVHPDDDLRHHVLEGVGDADTRRRIAQREASE